MAVTVFIVPVGVPLAACPTTIPGLVHYHCDTEAERPTPTNALGDTAFTADTDKNWRSDGTSWIDMAGTGGDPAWGGITGTLSAQTDLQAALDAKAASTHNILTAHNGFPGGTANFLRADGAFAAPTAEAAVTFTAFTTDLGIAHRSGAFDITGLSGLTADKPVQLFQTAAIIASKGDARDELEMDHIRLSGYTVNTTTIRCYWEAPSVVVGIYAFAYLVGA